MAIISRSTGQGAQYIDSDTGQVISREEVEKRIQSNQGSFLNKVADFFTPATDTEKSTSGSVASSIENYSPSNTQQLANLYQSNAYQQINPDTATRLQEAANILGADDATKNAIMASGMNDSQILSAAEAVAKYKQNIPDDWEAFTQENPATAKYLNEQKNMAMSWDDIKPLKKIEDAWTSIKDHASLADLEDRRAEIGNALLANGGNLSDLDASQRAELEDINSQIKAIQGKYGYDPNFRWYNPLTWDPANIAGGLAGMKNDVFAGLETGAAGAGIGAGMGLFAGGAGAIPGAFAGASKGFTLGLGFHMSDRAMGNSYLDNLMQSSTDGKNMDPGAAAVGAYMSGIGNAVIGVGGIGRLMSKIPGGQEIFDAFKKVLPEEELANPVVATNAWRTFAKNLAVSTAEQSVIFGGGTKAVELAAQRTAEQLSGLNYDHSGEPSALNQILQATEEFVPTAALMGGASSGLRLAIDLRKSPDSFETQKTLQDLNDAVSESKTATRSPDNIGTIVQDIAKDSPVEDVQIPANEWVRYWQEKVPDDENAPVEMATKAGVDPTEVQEAIATGGDITIKAGDFVKTFGNTEHFNGLSPDIRLRPDDFTQREQQQAIQDTMEQIQAMHDAAEGKGIDQNSETYQTAMEIAISAYPDKGQKILEKQANIIYALAQRADERGVLQALNIPDATTALKQLTVMRKDNPDIVNGLNQYAGENSQTAGKSMLEQAKDMGRDGKSNEEIRQATGWHKGMDGKWRYEIDDSKAAFKEPEYFSADLPEVLDHPELYKAYPDLKNISVNIIDLPDDKLGAFDRATNDIVINKNLPTAEKKKILLHEVQHAVQQQEGFARGGNPSEFSKTVMNPMDLYNNTAGEIEAWDTANRTNLSAEERKNTPPDLRNDSIILHQGNDQANRLGSYDPTNKIIELYKNANYSTLPHEMMHHFIELYRQAAENGNMPDEAAKDYRALQDFSGNKGEAWTSEQHEKITSAWEKYLSEGKAPSLELVGVFNKFKTWMLNIYKKLTGQGFEINDDIRQVFDRMLASDEQIAQSEMFYGSERLMGGKSMGLSSLKQYMNTLMKAHMEAQKQLYTKAMEDIKPEFQKRLQAYAEKVRAEESTNMRTKEPLYMAREAMEYGENIPDGNPGKEFIADNKGPLKLNKAETERQYGKGSVPKQFMSKNGKFTLDDIADIYGFQSGDELRQAVMNNKPFLAELDKRVAAKVAEFKRSEIGNIRDEAIKAVHNNYNLEAVSIEAEAIRKALDDMQSKNTEKLTTDWQKAKEQHKTDQKLSNAVQAEKDKSQAKLDSQQEKASQKINELQSKVDDAKESRRWDIAVNRGRLRAKAAKEAATRIIETRPIGEGGNWQKYVRQAVKAGKESSKALAKGEYETALQMKDQEILNHAMAMAAAKADKEIQSGVKYFKNFEKRGANMKGVPHEFNRQIDNILYRHNLINREPLQPIDPSHAMTLREFVDDCQNNYFYPQVADSVLNEADTRHYTRLSLNEFRDVKESVKSIHHVGKIMDKALADDRKETMTERIGQIANQLATHNQRYVKDFSIGQADHTLLEKLGRIPDMFNTSLVKMESFCRVIDKGETGPMTKYVLNPIYRAIDEYNRRSHDVMEKFSKVVSETGFTPKEIAKLAKDKRHFDFLPNDLSMAEIIQTALNWGNDGNKDRIRQGYFLRKDQVGHKLEDFEIRDVDSRVMKVLSQLDEKHWKLVQGIWDYLETYAPEVREHELAITGIDPKMIDSKPFQIVSRDGKTIDLKGGYYPIAYDPMKSIEAFKRQEELSALYISNPAVRAMTRHGHTEARVNSLSRPVLLDWSVLTNHLKNVNYDLAMRKAIIDVNRLLNNNEAKSAISNVLGVKTHGEMLNWLRYVASDQSETIRGGEELFRRVRNNTTKAALGFRLKAMFEDLPVNVLQSFWQMGITDTIKGLSNFYLGNWAEQKAFVDSKSMMMRERLSFLDRDIGDFSKTMFDNKNLSGKASKFIFLMDSMADAAIVYPMWQKAFSNALKKGMEEKDAILEADGFIRRTTADGSRAGLVNIQRGTEYSKVMTMFYTWYSGLFNRYWTSTKMAQTLWEDQQKVAAVGTMLRAGLYGWVLPGIISGVVKAAFSNGQTTNPQKQDEQRIKNFASAFITQPLGTIPVIGNLASYGVNKALGVYDTFNLSPIEGTLEKLVDVGPEAVKYLQRKPGDNQTGEKLAETALNAAAYGAVPGLPAYPMKFNTWAFNFMDWLNSNSDLSVSDIIARRHKAK